MPPLEEAIIEKLLESGPCSLDDLVIHLPYFSWGEIFITIDRMSIAGRVSLRQVGYSTYELALKHAA